MTPEMAQDELAMRLAYEFLFDIIPLEYLENENQHWLEPHLRNNGHTHRMKMPWSKARSAQTEQQYLWLM